MTSLKTKREARALGKFGEELAAKFMLEKGYELLHRNWRIGHQEVDLICRKKDLIVFVEVKTRKGKSDVLDLLTSSKEYALVEAANRYMQNEDEDLECRLDLMLITMNEKIKIEHIEGCIGY